MSDAFIPASYPIFATPQLFFPLNVRSSTFSDEEQQDVKVLKNLTQQKDVSNRSVTLTFHVCTNHEK
jgi:hypothetical protein